MKLIVPLLMLMLLSGCLIRTAANVVTLPVRAASQGVDWATTSRDEADRNRGRRERKAEKRAAKEQRKAAREAARDRPSY